MASDEKGIPPVNDIEGEELRKGAAVIFDGEQVTIDRVEHTPSGAFVILKTATPGFGYAYEVPSDMRCPDILQLDDDERGDGKTSS